MSDLYTETFEKMLTLSAPDYIEWCKEMNDLVRPEGILTDKEGLERDDLWSNEIFCLIRLYSKTDIQLGFIKRENKTRVYLTGKHLIHSFKTLNISYVDYETIDELLNDGWIPD